MLVHREAERWWSRYPCPTLLRRGICPHPGLQRSVFGQTVRRTVPSAPQVHLGAVAQVASPSIVVGRGSTPGAASDLRTHLAGHPLPCSHSCFPYALLAGVTPLSPSQRRRPVVLPRIGVGSSREGASDGRLRRAPTASSSRQRPSSRESFWRLPSSRRPSQPSRSPRRTASFAS